MHDNMTIADVGSIANVTGNRIATPLGPPRPGNTPTTMPSIMPKNIRRILYGVRMTVNPCNSGRICSNSSSSVLPRSVSQQYFQRPLRQWNEKLKLEKPEKRQYC